MIIAMFSTCVMAEKTGESKEIQIQEAVNAVVASYSKQMNNTAILLLLAKDGKNYQAAAGLADRADGRQVKSDDLFEIGSATKVFTGISILQLIESGKTLFGYQVENFLPPREDHSTGKLQRKELLGGCNRRYAVTAYERLYRLFQCVW